MYIVVLKFEYFSKPRSIPRRYYTFVTFESQSESSSSLSSSSSSSSSLFMSRRQSLVFFVCALVVHHNTLSFLSLYKRTPKKKSRCVWSLCPHTHFSTVQVFQKRSS